MIFFIFFIFLKVLLGLPGKFDLLEVVYELICMLRMIKEKWVIYIYIDIVSKNFFPTLYLL